jgi:hypothetical protein
MRFPSLSHHFLLLHPFLLFLKIPVFSVRFSSIFLLFKIPAFSVRFPSLFLLVFLLKIPTF